MKFFLPCGRIDSFIHLFSAVHHRLKVDLSVACFNHHTQVLLVLGLKQACQQLLWDGDVEDSEWSCSVCYEQLCPPNVGERLQGWVIQNNTSFQAEELHEQLLGSSDCTMAPCFCMQNGLLLCQSGGWQKLASGNVGTS